jgi:hypothetical protein
MKTFPTWMETEYEKVYQNGPLSTLIFGNRFKSEQTLYEYLTEFLLIFVSAKDADLQNGKMHFHDITLEKKFSYWVEPRMALRRFIFFDKSKKKGSIPEDTIAYKKMKDILIQKMEMDSDMAKEYLEYIQDLFHGYAAVVRNRFWGAQALLPICPEFILCGVDPTEERRRKKVDWENNPLSVDINFDFTRHNFLARGGELYYLHILQGIGENSQKKQLLEKLLNSLVNGQCNKISQLANFIQKSWEEYYSFDKKKLSQELKLAYIPETGYKECGKNSVDELINFLSSNIHPITRIDILAKGIMLQIMRMMTERVSDYLGKEKNVWIIDMRGETTNTVKKIAHESFRRIESDFMTALNKMATEIKLPDNERMKKIRKSRNDSLDIFKNKGKELQCIVPISGSFERFTLSEDIIRFLVLALVKPKEKMTLKMFLNKLYKHYKIIIGPEEYRMSQKNSYLESSLANCFVDNAIAFQNFLQATGFLKELSDATSVVINPYETI